MLCEEIIKKNSIPQSDVTVKHVYKPNKNGMTGAIVELKKEAYANIMCSGYIYIYIYWMAAMQGI